MRHPDHIGAKGTILPAETLMSKSLTLVLQIVLNSGLITRRFGQSPSKLLTTDITQVVLVDNQYAAIGGLDLCFGRWDTHTHPLADVHPTDFSKTLFPGQDFNNARIMDFKDVYDYVSNTLSIEECARMPWHDVSFNSFLDLL